MSDTNAPINELLREAEECEPVVREFAWVWVENFRRDAVEILSAHRREGRSAALLGNDPEPIRQEAEARLETARQRLLGRLQRLLAWARESGRKGG